MAVASMGTVYLVGAGPGESGLLTEKGRKCLETADVVVYDRLVSPQIIAHANPAAALIYVGKEANHHAVPQDEINGILVHHSSLGKTVVRLKGGDPFVFGRGGEEALALTHAGIPVEVVPGITSAVGALAYAGIPITHRQVATSFTVITGHECVSDEEALVDWSRMTDPHATLVILMGVGNLPALTDRLIRNGRSADTPTAAIRYGSRAAQETVVSTLDGIADAVAEAKLRSPAVIVVGDVVRLRDALAWYEEKPLFGQRLLVVSESEETAKSMAAQYEAAGAEATFVSQESFIRPKLGTIEAVVRSMVDPADEVSRWWFRSSLDVGLWVDALRRLRIDVRRLGRIQIGAANSSVAERLSASGIVADWIGPVSNRVDTCEVPVLFELTDASERLSHVLSGWSGMEWQLAADTKEARRWLLQQVHGADREMALRGGGVTEGVAL